MNRNCNDDSDSKDRITYREVKVKALELKLFVLAKLLNASHSYSRAKNLAATVRIILNLKQITNLLILSEFISYNLPEQNSLETTPFKSQLS